MVLFFMGLFTGLCIGPLPALLRLPTNLTALQANSNSAFLLQLNVCNDLAKAGKNLDLGAMAPKRSNAQQDAWDPGEKDLFRQSHVAG